MAKVLEIMRTGASAVHAQAVANTAGNITATGSSSQANAARLSYAVNYVTTASGADSVVLPTAAQGASIGDVVYVFVTSSTSGNLYPGGSDTANGSTSAITVAQNKMVIATRVTNSAWGYIITA